MPTSTLRTPTSVSSRFKTILWVSLGITALFVFITSEVLLVTDYPMYHAYRLQVIADRGLLSFNSHSHFAAPLHFWPAHYSSRRVSGNATLNSIACWAACITSRSLLVLSLGLPSQLVALGYPGPSCKGRPGLSALPLP